MEALLQVKAYQYRERIVWFFLKVQTLESFLVFGIFWINNVKKCCFPAGWWEGEDPCNETIKKIKFWNKLLILCKSIKSCPCPPLLKLLKYSEKKVIFYSIDFFLFLRTFVFSTENRGFMKVYFFYFIEKEILYELFSLKIC